MSGNIVKFDDAAATFERDLKVADLLCAGASVREVAKHQGCSVDQVEASLVRMTGGVSPALRERHFQIVYGRMERLHRAHYVKALKGDYDASVICLRANEFSARLFGLFPQASAAPVEDKAPIETTTDEIERVVDRIQKKTTTTIEGEVIESQSRSDDPNPESGDG